MKGTKCNIYYENAYREEHLNKILLQRHTSNSTSIKKLIPGTFNNFEGDIRATLQPNFVPFVFKFDQKKSKRKCPK